MNRKTVEQVKINQSALGDLIRDECDKQGLSLRKFAMGAQIDVAYISRLVNHVATSSPKALTLNQIADGLGLSRQTVYEAANYDGYTQYDIGFAIKNHQKIMNSGKPITKEKLNLIKAILDA